MGGLFGASLQAQQYLDNALYVKLKESSPVSAKSMGRKTVPLSSLGLKITQAKNNKFGLHQEARSMSLFNNPVLDKTFSISFDSTTQIDKLIRASKDTGIRDIAIGGGVSANSGLRNGIVETGRRRGWRTFLPEFKFTTDNAAMIAMAGYYRYKQGEFSSLDVSPEARMEHL